ncbi:hypothetical protein DRJ54_01400 [Candidatus Acetothermia bacterium]|nr:MAG: hypothetical protein DRJ54_01400 [Candidatus Acetothermia bacterium]
MRSHVRVETLPRIRARAWALPGVWAHALAMVLAGAVVAGLVFLYLWQGCSLTLLRAQRAHYMLELQRLERERAFLAARLDEELSSDRLMERARALGMCPYSPDRVIRLTLDDDQGTGP